MYRYLAMILACLFVSGAMTLILTWFFRRLNRIQQEQWGSKASVFAPPPDGTGMKGKRAAKRARKRG